MSANVNYSESLQQALLLAKKTALALGKVPKKSSGYIPVEGWELLNAIHLVDPRKVEVKLKQVLEPHGLTVDRMPWVDVQTIDDSAVQVTRFLVDTPIDENYISRGLKIAGGNRFELDHLLDALLLEPDSSLDKVFKSKSYYQELRNCLRSRIMGQDACIDALVDGIKVSRLRLNHKKPYSFALVGPTGVGKTELVKQLARFLFGPEDYEKHLLTINMSRYQLDIADQMIFGGSPFKGQPEGGILYPFLKQLSTKVPGSSNDYQLSQPGIILLDEIEKSHASTFMAFLSLLDEGLVETIHEQKHHRFHLTSDMLVFLTSNAGSSLYEDETIGARFLQNPEIIKETLLKESRWQSRDPEFQGRRIDSGTFGFRPEFISRIDTFVMLSKLQPSHMEKIAELNLGDLSDRVRTHPDFKAVETMEFDPAVKTLLAFKEGFQFGVRNLRTLVETAFVPPLISYADENSLAGVKRIRISLEDNAFRNRMCVRSGEVRVLAIDDPEDLRDPDDYRHHFKDLGFAWDSASSVSDALQLLKQNEYTFVLMDMHPNILQQIRRRFPSIPVFIFSDEASEDDRNRVLQSGGARDFLRKDLDEVEIQRQLRIFEQLAVDQNRITFLKSSLAGQANGLSFDVSGPQRTNDSLQLAITNIHPVYTPRTDDLGLHSQKRVSVQLSHVQGIEGIRPQIEELVEIFKHPHAYLALGASLPKGILLYGPPGTGKTMLAQAIAYETALPFLYSSSGVLASRYAEYGDRALVSFFAQARRNAPCVVFIDEIDGIGQIRTGFTSSTLLQSILTGLDGIRHHEQILFIAATNRPEILDPALTRAGRFDRKFALESPSTSGREAILRKLLDSYETANLDVPRIARLTFGFTGAQLVNLLNESAITSRRKGLDTITQGIVEEVIDWVKFGPETQALINPQDRFQTAVHELGHGILTLTLKTNPLHRLSIISRSDYLGISETLPEDKHHRKHRGYWLNKIAVCLGGRVAEEITFGGFEGQNPGVENDFEQATRLATEMVCRWGMCSSLRGCFVSVSGDYLGKIEKKHLFFSEQTAKEIDQAIQQLLQEAEGIARTTLEKYRNPLQNWAEILVEEEEMSGERLENLLLESNNA